MTFRRWCAYPSRETCYRLLDWDIYAILARVYEIETQGRPDKYVSIWSDNQSALKALQAAKTSPLVHRCQKVFNGVSTRPTVGLYWVPGHGRCAWKLNRRQARKGRLHSNFYCTLGRPLRTLGRISIVSIKVWHLRCVLITVYKEWIKYCIFSSGYFPGVKL